MSEQTDWEKRARELLKPGDARWVEWAPLQAWRFALQLEKFLRPAFYPDAEISVTLPVPHAKPPIFMAALYVDFGDGGWTCSATGRSPREACEALRDALSKTTH